MSILRHLEMLKADFRIVLASSSPRRHEILSELGLAFEVRTSDFEERISEDERRKMKSDGAAGYTKTLAHRKAEDVASRTLLNDLSSDKKHTIVIAADTCIETAEGVILDKPRDVDDATRMLEGLSGILAPRKSLDGALGHHGLGSTSSSPRATATATSAELEEGVENVNKRAHRVVTGVCLILCYNEAKLIGKAANRGRNTNNVADEEHPTCDLQLKKGKTQIDGNRTGIGSPLHAPEDRTNSNKSCYDEMWRFTEETEVLFRAGLTSGDIAEYIKTGEPFGKAGGYGIQGLGGLLVEKINGCHRNVVGFPLSRVCEVLANRLTQKELSASAQVSRTEARKEVTIKE
eukprot:g4931.t1